MKTPYIYILSLFLLFALTAEADNPPRKRKDASALGVTPLSPDEMPHHAPMDRQPPHPSVLSLTKKPQPVNINSRYMQGIDVSHHQGWINWDAVAASAAISYVYIKATEGNDFVDATYERNNAEARRNGLSVGAYHFYRPNVPWQQQFELIKRVIRKEDQDLVPMIDVEVRGRVSPEKFVSDLRKLVAAVAEWYECPPIVYTYQNFFNAHLSYTYFPGSTWMIAAYKETPPSINEPLDFEMWQYSDKGSLPGISCNVDRSCIMPGHQLQEMRMK